ncbi:MAG: hypothetical protein JW969_20090 [Spirochaetales bacterium]|nr:hypothetical protein [Spirochaetales bacterium]
MGNELSKIADILIKYYKPIEMIEHKYRTKVTAIGLLKTANMRTPDYLDPYLERLASYKGLIKDHIDNFKMAKNITVKIFYDILEQVYREIMTMGGKKEYQALDDYIMLVYPKYIDAAEEALSEARKIFISKYRTPETMRRIAVKIISDYLDTPESYDQLAEDIVKSCLTQITQEEVFRRINSAIYNFFVYGIYSRKEVADIYMITLKVKEGVIPMKYFTKASSLARAIINKVGTHMTTVNFFGKIWEDYEEIEKLFEKYINIKAMFY